MPTVTKQCARCKETLSAERFYKSKRTKTGLTSYCKVCDKTYKRTKGKRYVVSVSENTCRSCNTTKKAEDFWKDSSRKTGLSNACISCERSRMYVEKFGITLEEYEIMLAKQEGKCCICKQHESSFQERLAVDHCHTTGKVRGLLCALCNKGLGMFSDNQKIMHRAIEYLNAYEEKN